jgi:hypothetical protein
MGILTSNPYENAWIIAGVGLAVIIGASAIGGGVVYAAKDKLPTFEQFICSGAILISALIPLGLFSSGFFIDFINQSYQYSTGSIVGFFGALVTSIFGSSTFADFSKKAIGFLPPVKTADGNLSWLGVGVLALILAVLAGGSGAAFGAGGTQWGEGITIGVVTPIVLMLLAGYGFMGEFSPSPAPAMTGGSTFQINPYPAGYCDVPGFTWAANKMAPVSIVLTQTILWFTIIQNIASGNATHSSIVGAGSLLIFALQWFALAKNNCLPSYRAGVYSPLISLVISVAVAGASYGVLKNMPQVASGGGGGGGGGGASFTCPPGKVKAPSGECVSRLGPGGTQFEAQIAVGGEQKTSAPVDDDQDAFVCEAYKDGELITSTIVE